MQQETYCGYIAIVGRPNVGKSTLLNQLIGEKVSITSAKPQTTRHQIMGIATIDNKQFVYVDTPGIHQHAKRRLNKVMNKAAISILRDVDIIVWVVDSLQWTEEDQLVLEHIRSVAKVPVILVINKIDKVGNKDLLLPHIKTISSYFEFTDIVPVSAKSTKNLTRLQEVLANHLPHNEFFYDSDHLTNRSERFMIRELIREKIFRAVGGELPHAITVNLETFELKQQIYHIDALILVERDGQKRIIIGTKGEKLKRIGTESRRDIEALLGNKVFLRLWVKTKRGWTDSDDMLHDLGYLEI
ncbi:MAG: GTPase Era [Gammaproteobacteria bacterium]